MQNEPSSVYHYTSLSALLNMFNGPLMKDGKIVFRFSDPLQANDPKEINFFKDYVETNSKKGKEFKERWSKVQDNIGLPYIMCLIQHYNGGESNRDLGKQGYPFCEIPMWNMYGNGYKGVRIGFGWSKLKKYFRGQHIYFRQCEYCIKDALKDKGKKIRRDNLNQTELETEYKNSAFYKSEEWSYENEWRACLWYNDTKDIKVDTNNGKLYIEHPIPLDCINYITIGPKLNYKDVLHILETIKKKNEPYMKDIHFHKSYIRIR